MTVEIWEGALAPEAYELVLTSAAVEEIDLATVSAATMIVKDSRGVESEWTCSMVYSATPTPTLTLTHVFHVSTSELNTPGPWFVYAKLTVPSGIVRSKPRRIFVRKRFEINEF